MEYISAEEFLKQPKEVQRIFQEWWKPQKFDIYVDKTDITQEESFDYLSEGMLNHSMRDNLSYRRDMIPLFTEGQLRKFIEDKIGGKTDVTWEEESKYTIAITDGTGFYCKVFDTTETNLLKAYWKVACEIASSEVNNE